MVQSSNDDIIKNAEGGIKSPPESDGENLYTNSSAADNTLNS